MSPTWIFLIILGSVAAIAIVIGLAEIVITPFQIFTSLFAVGIFVGGGMLWYVFKDKQSFSVGKEDISDSEEFAVRWYKEKKGVDVVHRIDDDATAINFPGDDETFVGMTLHRADTDPIKAGLPIVCVVATRPLKMRAHYDDPSPQLLSDPFHIVARGFSGAPSAKAKADLDIGFQRGAMGQRSGSLVTINPQNPQKDFFAKETD